MKNKISFTSVLKSKSNIRPFNTSSSSSQYSIDSQPQSHQRLIDIYQQFQSYPDQDYTLNLNAFRNFTNKSRNNSMNLMAKSKNMLNQDPEMNLDTWIENQKIKGNNFNNTDSINKIGKFAPKDKGFKLSLNIPGQQEDNFQMGRNRSTMKKDQFNQVQGSIQQHYYNENIEDQENHNSQQRYGRMEQNGQQIYRMEQSQRSEQANNQRRSPMRLNKRNQESQQSQQQFNLNYQSQKMLESSKPSAQELLAYEEFKGRNQYPDLHDSEYDELQKTFEKIKSEKIAQLCMKTKKSINKEKLQEIVQRALENIYEEIQQMAENMRLEKVSKQQIQMTNYNKPQHEVQEESESLLIQDSRVQNQHQIQNLSNSEEQRRQQQMRNKIKDYITGIQQAKSHGKFSSTHYQNEPSFNQENTFNTSFNQYDQANEIRKMTQHEPKNNSQIDSVSYSFSNNQTNMLCEHSFSKDIMTANHNYDPYNNKFTVQLPIYEPENQDDQENQQKVSLPNIDEVRSDCGDYHQNQQKSQVQVESSEEIQYRKGKITPQLLEIGNNNIKNIESVHYEPPTQINYFTNHPTYQYQQNDEQRTQIFRRFEQAPQKTIENNSQIMQQQKISQYPSYNDQKFIPTTKTFNSYLSRQKSVEFHPVNYLSRKQSESSNQSSNVIKVIEPVKRFQPEKTTSGSRVILQQPLSSSAQSNPKNSLVEQSFHNESRHYIQTNNSLIMNNSLNYHNQSAVMVESTKNIHQLQSKNKFSISSPITKVQDLIMNDQKLKKQPVKITDVTHSNSQKINNSKASSKYAISSPQNQVGLIKKESENKTQITDFKYAFAQSISKNITNQETLTNNSLLQMKPLKISISNSNNFNFNQGQADISKDKVTSNYNSTKNQQISQGRQFLESLNTKQSIELEPATQKDMKDSFVQETFRPHVQNIATISHQKQQTHIQPQKVSITKITLRSSDKNSVTSPKVISLSINQNNKPANIQQFNIMTTQTKEKENIFKNLQIKQSVEKPKLIESVHMKNSQINKVHLSHKNEFDISSKQNNNTLNQIVPSKTSQNWKNESMRFDLNIDSNSTAAIKQSISTLNKPSILQKTQPLLKSSKHIGSSITQHHMTTHKISIGQSIKGKINTIGSSRNMKQSIKNISVKQSIGNDSEMDFDLELD